MAVTGMVWKGVGALSAVLAARAARSALNAGWSRTVGGDPPTDPASPRTTWTEAISWAVASGVCVGLARLVATRSAAAGWKKVAGSYPPGLDVSI